MIEQQDTYFSYIGNGITTDFAYGCRIFNASDLVVTVAGVVKAMTVDYTVSGVDAVGGGTVTFLPGRQPGFSEKVELERVLDYKRSTGYVQSGDFRQTTVDKDQDYQTALIQQLLRKHTLAADELTALHAAFDSYIYTIAGQFVKTSVSASSFGSDLSAAITAIGTAQVTLVVDSPITVNNNAATHANTSLVVTKPGALSVANGKTLTINGPFGAGSHQAFAGGYGVVFSSQSIDGIRPEWFGSDNNNIQRALDCASASNMKTVLLSGCTYNVGNAPLLVDSNCSLKGQGIGKTYLNLVSLNPNRVASIITNKNYPYVVGTGNNSLKLIDCNLMTSDSNILIKDLSVLGNKGSFAQGIFGISFWSVTDCSVENVEVDSTTAQGIIFTGAKRPSVTNCKCHHMGGDAIHFQDIFDGIVANNHVYATNDYGIEIASGYLRNNDNISTGFTTVIGNTAEGCLNYGIAIRGLVAGVSDTDHLPYNPNNKPCDSVVLANNIVRKNTSSGICIQEAISNCVVTGNTISDNTNYGILCTGSGTSGCVISSNVIMRNGMAGFYSADGSLDITIDGNTIASNGTEAIKGTFARAKIVNNTIMNNNTTQVAAAPFMDFSNSNFITIANNSFKISTGDTFTTKFWTRTNSGQFYMMGNVLPNQTFIDASVYGAGDFFLDPFAASGNGFGFGYQYGVVGPGSVVPKFIGQEYFNGATGDWWKSFGTGAGMWFKLNN